MVYRVPGGKEEVTEAGESKEDDNKSCSFKNIYNIGLMKKPTFAIFLLSNIMFEIGINAMHGFALVCFD